MMMLTILIKMSLRVTDLENLVLMILILSVTANNKRTKSKSAHYC